MWWLCLITVVVAYPVTEFFQNIDSTKCISARPECQSNCFAHPVMQICGAVYGTVGNDELMTSLVLPAYAPVVWPTSLYVTLVAPSNWNIPLVVSKISLCHSDHNLIALELLTIADLNQASPFTECVATGSVFTSGITYCANLTCVIQIPTNTLTQGYNQFRFTYLNAVTNASVVTSMVIAADRESIMAGCNKALSGNYICTQTCYILDGIYVCEDAAILHTSDYNTMQTILIAILVPFAILLLLLAVGSWKMK